MNLNGVLVATLVILLGGCLGDQTVDPIGSQGPSVADGAEGRAVELWPTEHFGSGGEPTIGVTQDRTMFTNAWDTTIRSTDGGKSWETVLDIRLKAAGATSRGSGDPWVWADPVTDRVFSMHGMFPCTVFWWSDDRGNSWVNNQAGCVTPYNDHPQLTSGRPGPDPNPLAGVDYPSVLYQCFNAAVAGLIQIGGAFVGEEASGCVMSYDGGQTWPLEQVLTSHAGTDYSGCRYLHSPAAIAPDGVVGVAVGAGSCEGFDVHVSRDSGLTWQMIPGPRSPRSALATNPSEPHLAWSDDGALYALWQGADFLRYLARADTLDGTWSEPWPVTAPGVKTTEFQALQAGTAGRVALGYLGTRDSAGNPHEVPPETQWYLFFATSENTDSSAPTFVHHQATPDDDPVQIGCTGGSGGVTIVEQISCDNLGHFFGGAATPDGTFLVSFTDGCGPDCVEAADSRGTHTVVAALTGWNLDS